ncbi:hypothetical protein [Priestia abyssalis]|uniref:hypothetical protein n=1 Tax=Priestia abyssalis TaxID=1221450 RepID=UPI00099492A9|nr:hypothetical protein [Priestia abyssalis]
MENEKRIMGEGSVKGNRVSEEFRLQIKQMPYYQIIQKKFENPNDHLYAVVTPVDNMETFQKKYF